MSGKSAARGRAYIDGAEKYLAYDNKYINPNTKAADSGSENYLTKGHGYDAILAEKGAEKWLDEGPTIKALADAAKKEATKKEAENYLLHGL